MLRVLLGWSAAVVTTALIGSVVQSQINLSAIAGLGHAIAPGERLSMTMFDLMHFAPIWAAIVAFAFLLAWPVAGFLSRRYPAGRVRLFPAAGFVAILAALLVMELMLPITVLAAARSLLGVLLLAAGGALGGWVYVKVVPQRQNGRI